MQEETEKIAIEETKEAPKENKPFVFKFDESKEEDLLKDIDSPREGFEDTEEQEEPQDIDYKEEQEQPTISETTEEDLAYFKMAMGFLDNTRAMGLSLMVDGNLDNVDALTYYDDWSDKKHAALLQSGAIVARKYKFSAFKLMPEFMIAMALIISSVALYKQAKTMKSEKQKAKQPQKTTKETPIFKLKKIG